MPALTPAFTKSSNCHGRSWRPEKLSGFAHGSLHVNAPESIPASCDRRDVACNRNAQLAPSLTVGRAGLFFCKAQVSHWYDLKGRARASRRPRIQIFFCFRPWGLWKEIGNARVSVSFNLVLRSHLRSLERNRKRGIQKCLGCRPLTSTEPGLNASGRRTGLRF
jgi:hypothetical protein